MKVLYDCTNKDIYKECKEAGITYSYAEYNAILRSIHSKVFNKILNGKVVLFPYGFGAFFIRKFKSTSLFYSIDWVKSKARGKRIMNFNSHSDGYRFKTRWQSKFVSHSQLYYFALIRKWNRELATKIKTGFKDYREFKY